MPPSYRLAQASGEVETCDGVRGVGESSGHGFITVQMEGPRARPTQIRKPGLRLKPRGRGWYTKGCVEIDGRAELGLVCTQLLEFVETSWTHTKVLKDVYFLSIECLALSMSINRAC
jgi:hypothetical protein